MTEVIKPTPDPKEAENVHSFTGIDLTIGLGTIIEERFEHNEVAELFGDDLNRMGELTLSEPNSEQIVEIAQEIRSKLRERGVDITDSDISEAIDRANQQEIYLDQKEQERLSRLSPPKKRREKKQMRSFKTRMLRKTIQKTGMTSQEVLFGLGDIRDSFHNPHP